MKSKKGIIFISVVIAVLLIILALLVNHLVCRDGIAPPALLSIDSKITSIYHSITNAFTEVTDYIKYVFMKASAIQTPEYPSDYLPLYSGSRVLEYSFDQSTNSVLVSCGTNDTFDSIMSSYYDIFSGDLSVSYFKQYIINDKYTAYGMIGNFVFFLEAQPSENEKYRYEINTQLHYLTGSELLQENFFRLQGGINSQLYTTPYIYMYQLPADDDYICFQLRDYKSRLLAIETNVELYIDEELYGISYYDDTIRVPVSLLSGLHDIKMISYDGNDCIRAFDIMEKTLVYDAAGQSDFYELASNYNSGENLYIINTDDVDDISYLIYFTNINSLYLEGSESIQNYSTILSMDSLKRLFLKNTSSDIFSRLNSLADLKTLEISYCSADIQLGNDFVSLPCSELTLDNCSNLYFDDYGLFSVNLESLTIKNNYSLESIGLTAVYPNLRSLSFEQCDGLLSVLITSNLPNINSLEVSNCLQFDLTQSFDNTSSLMNVNFADNPALGEHGEKYIHSIWTCENLVTYSIEGCRYINDIDYAGHPWEKVK